MKNILFIITLLIFISTVFCIYYYISHREKVPHTITTTDNKNLSIPTVNESEPSDLDNIKKNIPDSFTIIKESGVITYKLPDSDNFINLELREATLPFGSVVKTAKDSRSHVLFPNNSVMSIDADTEVEIKGDKDKMEILQIIGRTWHRIRSLGSSQSYQVKTDTAIAAVRGTKFEINTKRDTKGYIQSEISLLEGKIDCHQLAAEGDKKISKASKLLEANDSPTTVTLKDFNTDKSWNQRKTPSKILNEKFAKEMQDFDKLFDINKESPDLKSKLEDKLQVKGSSTQRNKSVENTKDIVTILPSLNPTKITASQTPTPKPTQRDTENPKIIRGYNGFKSNLVRQNLLLEYPLKPISFKFRFEDNYALKKSIMYIDAQKVSECDLSGKKDECTFTWAPNDRLLDQKLNISVVVEDNSGNKDTAYKDTFTLKKNSDSDPEVTPKTSKVETHEEFEIFIDDINKTITEASDNHAGYIKFRLSKPLANDVFVRYTVTGSASNIDDYIFNSEIAKIFKGDIGIDIPFTIIDDEKIESDETVVVNIISAEVENTNLVNLKIRPKNEITYIIKDNDIPSLIKIKAKGNSTNNILPQIILYINDPLEPVFSFDLEKSEKEYSYVNPNLSLKNGDKIYFYFDNDTRDNSLFPFLSIGSQDRSIELTEITIGNRIFEFPNFNMTRYKESTAYKDGFDNRIIYDRSNKDTLSKNDWLYFLGNTLWDFGNYYDGIGVVKYGDVIDSQSIRHDYFDRVLDWNGAIIVKVDWM